MSAPKRPIPGSNYQLQPSGSPLEVKLNLASAGGGSNANPLAVQIKNTSSVPAEVHETHGTGFIVNGSWTGGLNTVNFGATTDHIYFNNLNATGTLNIYLQTGVSVYFNVQPSGKLDLEMGVSTLYVSGNFNPTSYQILGIM